VRSGDAALPKLLWDFLLQKVTEMETDVNMAHVEPEVASHKASVPFTHSTILSDPIMSKW